MAVQPTASSVDRFEQDLPADDRAWGVLAVSFIRNPGISAAALFYAAHRNTFVGAWASWDELLLGKNGIARGPGFGRDVIERARAELIEAKHLFRWQPEKDESGRFMRAKELLKLPDAALRDGTGLLIWRKWFNRRLSVNEMAAYLYLRAGTGKGPAVFAVELRERFGWSHRTAMKVLNGLMDDKVKLVRRDKSRKEGRITGVTYRALAADLWGNDTSKQKSGHGAPGHGLPGHLLTFGLAPDAPPVEDSLQTYDLTGRQNTSPGEVLSAQSLFEKAFGLIGEPAEGRDRPVDIVNMEVVHHLCARIPDAWLISQLRHACGQRVKREILSPAGAMGLRILAAYWHAFQAETCGDEADTPEALLARILEDLDVHIRVGGRKLRNLNLVTRRISFWGDAGGDHLWARRHDARPNGQEIGQ